MYSSTLEFPVRTANPLDCFDADEEDDDDEVLGVGVRDDEEGDGVAFRLCHSFTSKAYLASSIGLRCTAAVTVVTGFWLVSLLLAAVGGPPPPPPFCFDEDDVCAAEC